MNATPFRLLWAMPLLLMVGCRSGDSVSEYEPIVRTGLLMEPANAQAVGYLVNWATHLNVPDSTRITSLVVLDDLILVVESPDNRITAVSVRDGDTRWSRIISESSTKLFKPMRRDDHIYVASPTRLYTLAASDGDLEHVDRFDTTLGADPILAEGFALCGGFTGEVFAHDLASGYRKWGYDLTARIAASPVEAGFNVFAVDTNGIYAMLAVSDGAMLWRGRTFGPISASAAIDQLGVYVASQDQTLYALDRATGQEKWKLPLEVPLTASPVSMGLTLYLPIPGRGMIAIDTIEGRKKWEIPHEAAPIRGDEDHLLVTTGTSLELLDATNGALIARGATLPLQTVLTGPDDSIVLVSPRGRMLRLNPLR